MEDFFTGKIVTVYTQTHKANASVDGLVLRNVKLQEIGGRRFLVGVGADTGHKENWTIDKVAAVSWDSVVSVFCMSEEQLKGMQGKTFKGT